jgi:hypothetical protein
MTRRTLVRVAAAAISLAAVLVLLEIPAYFRWIDWSGVVGLPHAIRYTHLKPWDNPANVRDEELLYRHRPGLRFTGETPGDLVDLFGIATDRKYRVDVAYDENGFRNPPGRTRADVVLVGDSFLEAGLVPYEETIPAILERKLDLVVQNLGCSGYGPQQEKIVLERYGLPLRPRFVVWFFFEGNDLADVGRYEEARRTGGQDPRKTRFLARSLTANLARRIALLLERPRREDAPQAKRRMGTFRGNPMYFAFAGERLTEADRAHLERAKALILEAANETRKAGARFLLVHVPTKFRVYRHLTQFAPDTECAAWEANELPSLMEEFARESGIEFVQASLALYSGAAAGEIAYFPDDGHWNSRGHAIVAELLRTKLR